MESLLIPMGGIGLHHLLLAFAGGVVGACFAALPAFAICGIFGEKRFKPPLEKAWLPHQFAGLELLVLGLSFGLFSSYLALILGPDHGGVVPGFGISALSLLLFQVGFNIPVTHHITLIAAGATVASGGSLIWGALFGTY